MKILLPIDGSACSEQTLRWVANSFNKTENEFYLLMVINPVPDFEIQDCEMTSANHTLEKARKLLEGAGCKVVNAQRVVGETLMEILGIAHEIPVDQVILGSNGRTGWSKLILGSTSIGVLEKCKCSVVVYKNNVEK